MAFPEQPSLMSAVLDVFAHQDLAANPVLEKVVVYLSLHFDPLCFDTRLDLFWSFFGEWWLEQLFVSDRSAVD
jgi:hypothetical protein